MSDIRILYFREGMLEAAQEVACDDLLEAARLASSLHPHLTAEIWWAGKKAAIVRPRSDHRHKQIE